MMLAWRSVASSYPMTQAVYLPLSQCDDQLVYTIPLAIKSAARSL